MKLKLLPKFVISLGVLGVVLTLVISLFSYQNSKTYLEEMYAERVLMGSKAIAAMLPAEDIRAIQQEGGDQTETYDELVQLLNKLKQDGEITFLSITVPDEDSVTFYIDTCVEEMGDDPANQIPYGTDVPYSEAAIGEKETREYIEVYERFRDGVEMTKPMITDNDYGYNYTAVAHVMDENGQSVADVQYILDMRDVRGYLTSLLNTMLLISLAIIGIALLLYVLVVKKMVTTPIAKLANFTHQITESGQFEGQHIEIPTGDEIEELGDSFNYMMEELDRYIENLSLVTAEKERIGAELGVATQIQASMLPCIFPAFPGRSEFDIYATMQPAKEVGGDFYDFFLVDDNHLAMVIADVSGKGVPAALFMVIAKTLIKNSAQNGLSPADVLAKVNNQLCENNEAEMFVTVWLGILEISTGKMTCANAGHEYPAICRKDQNYELLMDKHGFVVAGMENMKYKQYEVQLNPGDRLYVYTDGVPEATDTHEELFGTDRMIQALNENPKSEPEELLHRVKQDIDIFVGEAPQFDDITMLGLHYYGPDGKEGDCHE